MASTSIERESRRFRDRARRLQSLAKAVAKNTVLVKYGDIVPSDGYVVNARALEQLADFLCKHSTIKTLAKS